MADIGKPTREIEVEPLEEPISVPVPSKEPVKEPVPA